MLNIFEYNGYTIRQAGFKWYTKSTRFEVYERSAIPRLKNRLFLASFATLAEAQAYVDGL